MTTETITATLHHIRYQNDTGFIIAMASNEDVNDQFGILGNMLHPQEDMTYKLSGQWSRHSEYGLQFKFQNYSQVAPQDPGGIYKYLVRTVKHVGPAIAQALTELYGNQTLDVLRESPELAAAEVRGITEARATEIQKTLLAAEEDENLLVELMDILDLPGLRKSLPFDLINEYGGNAVIKLKENPYILTQFHGTGFLAADRLALQKLNIDSDSMFRLNAAVIYAMEQDLNGNGNTWMNRQALIFEVNNLTSIGNLKRIELCVYEMIMNLQLVETPAGGEWVALFEVDRAETYVAQRIKEMVKGEYDSGNSDILQWI